ncbi:MAG TPA: Rid family detoxifying hydrolase [Desulfovibrio sp.]|jgi:2-iminobutanoate/2-iminopropanoate deaminase|uniref:Rid family detoxifying hydrolase n=1 Tax=Desulfovibrio sp. TaxID=885 RepID=UPI002A451978|nr:Rid family detoxifying hydrolase [Desulfovibrio sp.]MDY0306831.1 Rid family detoxifying hydrolase [Desulfovibrionaceae bacterium]HMM38553.1 Rid family detoxifying hydrolase [Desulfovibrio sp.]
MRRIIFTDKAPGPVGPYSQAVRHGGLVFASGQVAIDPVSGEVVYGGVAEQTELALKNLRAVLEAAGSGLDRILKCNVYLADIGDFEAMNEVYKRYFTKDYPARLTVAVGNMFGGLAVEMDAIAAAE